MKSLFWLVLIVPAGLLGQVERIGGFPGTITDLILYQDQLYLRGSGQTQFKYEPETASWQRNGPQDYQNKTLLGIDFLTVQDSIWLGLSSGWIVRSTDGGRTASRVLLEQRNHTWEAGLWYAGDGEYYCYLNNSLWRSTDYGRSFAKLAEAEYLVTAGKVGEYAYYFERTKEDLRMIRSKDNFATKEQVNIPPVLRRSPISVISLGDQIVFSNHEEGLVYISPDAGVTWGMGVVDSTIAELVRPDYNSRSARYRTISGDHWVNEFYKAGDTLYICAKHGVYQSVEGNPLEWKKLALPNHFYMRKLPYVNALRRFEGELYLQLGQNSIVRYDGNEWREVIDGLDWGWAGDMYESDDQLYVNTQYPYLYYSADGGQTFSSAYSSVAKQLELYFSLQFFSLGDYDFAYERQLFRSPKTEDDWSPIMEDNVRDLLIQGNTIWVLAGRQLSYSKDYGGTWEIRYDFTPHFGQYPEYGQLVSMHKEGREIIVSIGVPGEVGYIALYSKNNGKTFEQVADFPFTSYAASQRELLVFTRDSTVLQYSDNMGQGWTSIPSPCTNPQCGIRDMEIWNGLFILSTGDGVFYSEDKGASWKQYFPELFEEYFCTELYYYDGKWISTCLFDGGGLFEFTDYPFTAKD